MTCRPWHGINDVWSGAQCVSWGVKEGWGCVALLCAPLCGSVNVGCVPKKIMFNTATVFEAIHQARNMGITVEGEPKLDW